MRRSRRCRLTTSATTLSVRWRCGTALRPPARLRSSPAAQSQDRRRTWRRHAHRAGSSVPPGWPNCVPSSSAGEAESTVSLLPPTLRPTPQGTALIGAVEIEIGGIEIDHRLHVPSAAGEEISGAETPIHPADIVVALGQRGEAGEGDGPVGVEDPKPPETPAASSSAPGLYLTTAPPLKRSPSPWRWCRSRDWCARSREALPSRHAGRPQIAPACHLNEVSSKPSVWKVAS